MTQTAAHSSEPVTGHIPGQRPPDGHRQPVAAARNTGLLAVARRAFTVARSLRSLRPVPALPQEPYGEVDGQ